ncbi:MAG: hypothetical protein HY912_15360 [Desulfomonile tiedjei]|uniref:Uncharacterized protein n=1 Tax=Desulfomonile tiedjei TaxID=2358 RepID=A0A9D6V3I9_9BACT|nr:hypothetical protein [Desulfomonile tiedjei]
MAERLTTGYFCLPQDEWRRNPYGVFTRKEVDVSLYEKDAFANVVRYRKPISRRPATCEEKYGIVLQDPNILLALLRSSKHDLWSMGLFILTHELAHIVRFRKFGVDFFAAPEEAGTEERIVHDITREILAGVTNTDYIINLYQHQLDGMTVKKPS